MPTAAVDEPRFFLDRGLGSQIVPTTLRARGWSLTTMDERYGTDRSQAVGDEEWISDAAVRGEILLCKDRAVARNVAEARAIYMHDARVFALARADLTGPAMAALLLDAEQRLLRMAVRARGPYVVSISPNGLTRLRLAYPLPGGR
ncbi:MAG: hypothetical protein NTW05_22470 [Pseudonocardiales bacterium]|jgi:hypothetical protein|nr:hypothetical protein [Pseudonocardiales bacterium]